MDARDWFLADHARIHAFDVARPEGISIADLSRSQLTDAQLREAPFGHVSIAWLVWHLARSEDVIVNRVLRQVPEVFDRGAWSERLGVGQRHLGTGSSDTEHRDLSLAIDLDALRGYQAAVARETRAWAAATDFDALTGPVDSVTRLSGGDSDIGPRARWLPKMWDGRSAQWLLSWGVVGHAHLHFGEAMVVRSLLGGPDILRP